MRCRVCLRGRDTWSDSVSDVLTDVSIRAKMNATAQCVYSAALSAVSLRERTGERPLSHLVSESPVCGLVGLGFACMCDDERTHAHKLEV